MMKHSALAFGTLLVAFISSCQADPERPLANTAGSPSAGSGGSSPVAGNPGSVGGSASQAGIGNPSGGMAGAGVSGGAPGGGSAQAGQAGATAGGGGADGGGSGSGGAGGLPALEECAGKASIDRLTSWNASGEGLTVPA